VNNKEVSVGGENSVFRESAKFHNGAARGRGGARYTRGRKIGRMTHFNVKKRLWLAKIREGEGGRA